MTSAAIDTCTTPRRPFHDENPAAVARDASERVGDRAGRDGGAYSGTFTIHWTQSGSKLGGSIALSNPRGMYSISGSMSRGGAISFGAVGAGATYTGSVSGKSMSGRYKTARGGGSWSAHKAA